MKSYNKVGRCVDNKAAEPFFMAASGVTFAGGQVGVVCSSVVELDRETILTRFDPNALILDAVSSGIVDT